MKFIKFDIMGKCYLLFSLPASFDALPALSASACHFKNGASADGAVFLSPSLMADFAMTAFDKEGKETLTHEALRCVGSYLSICVGLPMDEYTVATSDGVVPLKLVGSFPHEISVKYSKCKQKLTKRIISVHNVEYPVLIASTPSIHAVLLVNDVTTCDLPAVRGAILREGDVYSAAPLVSASYREGELCVSAEYRDRGVAPPTDEAIAAALLCLILEGKCKAGRYYTVRTALGCEKMRIDTTGAVSTLGRAEVLFRGDYTL